MGFPQNLLLQKQKNFCRVKLICPAKINLYLNILGKYPNGFHRIESIVNRISLYDELTIKVSKHPQIRFFCSDKSLEKDNLCVRAVTLLREKFKIKQGFTLYLRKNIPVGGGLGGGSSDAASTILGIDILLNLGLSSSELHALGKTLGSDVNFFLCGASFAYLSGRGDEVKPLETDIKLLYLIAYPNLRLSTKLVYQNVKAKLTNYLDNVKMIFYALKERDWALLDYNLFNVLEEGAFSLSPLLKRNKIFLKRKGFRMTGSGSAFFTIVKRKENLTTIRRGFPKNWEWFVAQSM